MAKKETKKTEKAVNSSPAEEVEKVDVLNTETETVEGSKETEEVKEEEVVLEAIPGEEAKPEEEAKDDEAVVEVIVTEEVVNEETEPVNVVEQPNNKRINLGRCFNFDWNGMCY